MRAEVPLKALETAFQGIRLHISVAGLIASTLATLSASHLLAEVAAKLALTAVAVSAAEGALVGPTRRVYLLSVLALPPLTFLYYSIASPKIAPLDLVLLPLLSSALGLCLVPDSYPPRRPLLPLLSLFSACYAITSAKVLDPGFEPAHRVLQHIALSLFLVATGVAVSRALSRYVERVFDSLWGSDPQSSVAGLEHLPGLEGLLTSATRAIDRLASVPIKVVYTALIKLVSLVSNLEETSTRLALKAFLALETAQNHIERSLTYSLLLVGLLSTIALVAYAFIKALR